MKDGWMVKAEGGSLIGPFKTNNCVAIGWRELGDVSGLTKEQIYGKYRETYPNEKPKTMYQQVGSILRFYSIREGDVIVSYDTSPEKREYLVGSAISLPEFDGDPPKDFADYPNQLKVEWRGVVKRKELSPKARHKLGGIHTVFDISEVITELESLLKGEVSGISQEEEEIEEKDLIEDTLSRADELIKDSILELSEEEVPKLVAGLLRAIGYQTKLSARGSDRGKDIIAGPDRLGLEKPRFLVEVKHRTLKISAKDIRNFISVIQDYHEGGLFVSTGDFAKDARYEAERARVPLTLIELEDLVELIKENYEELDIETRELIPLFKIYWPK